MEELWCDSPLPRKIRTFLHAIYCLKQPTKLTFWRCIKSTNKQNRVIKLEKLNCTWMTMYNLTKSICSWLNQDSEWNLIPKWPFSSFSFASYTKIKTTLKTSPFETKQNQVVYWFLSYASQQWITFFLCSTYRCIF